MSDRAPAAKPSLTPDQVETVRAFHRRAHNAGFLACLIGVLVMIAGRFMPGAPAWLANVGLGGIVFGWGLLGYALVKRVGLARSISTQTGG